MDLMRVAGLAREVLEVVNYNEVFPALDRLYKFSKSRPMKLLAHEDREELKGVEIVDGLPHNVTYPFYAHK